MAHLQAAFIVLSPSNLIKLPLAFHSVLNRFFVSMPFATAQKQTKLSPSLPIATIPFLLGAHLPPHNNPCYNERSTKQEYPFFLFMKVLSASKTHAFALLAEYLVRLSFQLVIELVEMRSLSLSKCGFFQRSKRLLLNL